MSAASGTSEGAAEDSTSPVPTRSLIVVGEGAEGVHDPLGRVLVRLTRAGWTVVGIDPVADAACSTGKLSDVVRWSVDEFEPELVLVVAGEGAFDLGLPEELARLTVTPAVGLEALERLADEQGGSAPASPGTRPAVAEEDVLPVLDVLRRLSQTCRGPLLVRERSPRVTIVAPFYGVAEYVHATMISALSQTYDDYEVLALDDGSTDGTASVLEQYRSNPRVRIVRQENIGQTARMDVVNNQLVRHAHGELIACLGGDDVCFPTRLAAQVEAFDTDPALDVCHGTGEFLSATGRTLGRNWGIWAPYDEWSLLRVLVRENVVGHPSVMIRKDAVIEQGWYEQGLATDYHFWLKTAGKLRYRYLPQRLLGYRLHDKSLSTSTDGFANAQRESRRLRALVMRQRPLEDFWPELRGSLDVRVRNEAAIALGNSLLGVDPRLAVMAYAHATSSGSADALHNTAIAHALAGERPEALKAAQAASVRDRSSAPLLKALRSGRDKIDVKMRAPQNRLLPALRQARKDNARSVLRWDGTTLDVDRAYVALHPQRDDLGRAALEAWCRSTRDGDPIRWIHPTLGEDPAEVHERVLRLSHGLDLASAAEMVIEQVDGFQMMPPHEPSDRLTLVLTVGEELNEFRRWILDPSLGAVQRDREAALQL